VTWRERTLTAALAAAVALAACSPALNWRQVPLERISAFLPCKPDRAQRTLRLGERDVTLSMAGCEAAGALFAVSHIPLADTTATAGLVQDWRAAMLANIRATAVVESPLTVPPGFTAASRIAVQGQRPDGSPVQGQLVWLVSGSDVFHFAVYGERLTPELVDTFFSDTKIQ
jgi:hypothetical protein